MDEVPRIRCRRADQQPASRGRGRRQRSLRPRSAISTIEVVDGFGEHDPGEDCDGMSFDEFVEVHGDRGWEDDPFTIGFPGGETLAAFHVRIGETIADTVKRYDGKSIVVMCHGGVVDAALRQALRAPFSGTFDIWTLNASITELQQVKPGRWRLLRYNDHAHLAGLDSESSRE